MNILIAGAHGTTGQILTERLVKHGHAVKGAVRKPEQVSTIRDMGAEPVMMDLTQPETFPQNLAGIDVVVFAAGSGGKAVEAVDRDGAISLVDAAKTTGVDRFVMLSSMLADTPEAGPEYLQDYLRAKGEADAYLKKSGLDYAIVRPVALTNEAPTGKVKVEDINHNGGEIPRADVAHVLQAAVERPEVKNSLFELQSGDKPVDRIFEEELVA